MYVCDHTGLWATNAAKNNISYVPNHSRNEFMCQETNTHLYDEQDMLLIVGETLCFKKEMGVLVLTKEIPNQRKRWGGSLEP